MSARSVIAVIALVLPFVLAACPETAAVVDDHCAQVGTPCRLPSGPLGVCSESLAAACEHPPCLACTSQH